MTGSTSATLFLLSLFLVLSFLFTPIHGQADIVTFVSDPAYARVGSKLYVVGGGFIREVIDDSRNHWFTSPQPLVGDGQTIVLDLSVPWDAATPAWKQLQKGPKQMDFTGTLNADGSKFVTFRSGINGTFAMLYDVATNTWSPSKVTVDNPNRNGIAGVLDPTTNKVYLPFGYDNNLSGDQMYIYDFNTDSINKTSMAATALTNSLYFEGVWWSTKKSILFFGGYTYPSQNLASNVVNMYTPSTDSWSHLTTKGTGPSSRSDMCVSICRIIHSIMKQTISSEIFVLDLNTMTWTRGRDYSKPRTYSVCTIVNGNFLSWGGTDDQQTVSDPVIIYDLKRNKYLSKYMGTDPDSDYDPSLGPQKDQGRPGSGSGSTTPNYYTGSGGLPTGAIVGIAVGAVVFISFFIWALRYNMRLVNRFLNQPVNHQVVYVSPETPTSPRGRTTGARHGNSPSVIMVGPPQSRHGGHQQYPLLDLQSSQAQHTRMAPSPSAQTYPPLAQQEHSPAPRRPSQNTEEPPPVYTLSAQVPRGPETRSDIEDGYIDDMGVGNSRSSLVSSQDIGTARAPQQRNP
ncbi:hypothetical protein BGX34_001431 [Mortierella sp. NVP85]|nr:hypothetical protein BGX34_001431 [Mortierella sp. NVP85]